MTILSIHAPSPEDFHKYPKGTYAPWGRLALEGFDNLGGKAPLTVEGNWRWAPSYIVQSRVSYWGHCLHELSGKACSEETAHGRYFLLPGIMLELFAARSDPLAKFLPNGHAIHILGLDQGRATVGAAGIGWLFLPSGADKPLHVPLRWTVSALDDAFVYYSH